jgi:hypothetical protein
MPVKVPNQSSPRGFRPESLCQPPLEDVGTEGRWPGPLARGDEIFPLAEVFLPDASTPRVDPLPLGVIVVGVPLELLGFEPFQRRLLDGSATRIGDRKMDFNSRFAY